MVATAWIRLEAFDLLPDVCAKTGAPADVRVTVVAEYIPATLRWLQLFAVWTWLTARFTATRRRSVRLPVSRSVRRRYRTWRLGAAVVFVAGVSAGLTGSLGAHPLVELAGYGAAVVASAVGVRSEQRNWVGLNVDRRGREVTVTRCHPDFARAAGRVAAASRPSR